MGSMQVGKFYVSEAKQSESTYLIEKTRVEKGLRKAVFWGGASGLYGGRSLIWISWVCSSMERVSQSRLGEKGPQVFCLREWNWSKASKQLSVVVSGGGARPSPQKESTKHVNDNNFGKS